MTCGLSATAAVDCRPGQVGWAHRLATLGRPCTTVAGSVRLTGRAPGTP